MQHQLPHDRVKQFILAGNALFTVRNAETGNRFTYRARVAKDDNGDAQVSGPYFVQVLTGPENTSDYTYLGTIFHGEKYFHGRKSRIGEDAQSNRVFQWFFHHLNQNSLPDAIEVWHEGRCCVCGRTLTDPESIELGIGPVCRGEQ